MIKFLKTTLYEAKRNISTTSESPTYQQKLTRYEFVKFVIETTNEGGNFVFCYKKEFCFMIEEQIKKANIQAMKDKDAVARSFYSVLNNKILLEKISKGQRDSFLPDADVSNIIQKMIKELNDEKANYEKVGNKAEVETLSRQLEIASSYLPKMLSVEEIKGIIVSLPDKTVPAVMKHFKANFNGQVDMRLVQEVLRSL